MLCVSLRFYLRGCLLGYTPGASCELRSGYPSGWLSRVRRVSVLYMTQTKHYFLVLARRLALITYFPHPNHRIAMLPIADEYGELVAWGLGSAWFFRLVFVFESEMSDATSY